MRATNDMWRSPSASQGLWVQAVSDYRYDVDPFFDDNSEWVKCNECEIEYDMKEYGSETCIDCENKHND